MTNAPEHAQRLCELSRRASVEWLPIPSNIPPPADLIASFSTRRRGDFVIFGLPFTQLLTVQAFARELAAWRAAGVLERLHLVGPTDATFAPQTAALLHALLPEESIVRHGPLEPSAVSEVLSHAGFCLTQNTETNFSKSGTFAAFAAHGCAVVSRMSPIREPLGYIFQPEEVSDTALREDFLEFERRARALREWYLRESDWPAIAARIRDASGLPGPRHS
jgi:hypothetical protein